MKDKISKFREEMQRNYADSEQTIAKTVRIKMICTLQM